MAGEDSNKVEQNGAAGKDLHLNLGRGDMVTTLPWHDDIYEYIKRHRWFASEPFNRK